MNLSTNPVIPVEKRTIPETFSKNGWNYTLIHRDGDYAIYKQGGCAFEVHVIRKTTKDYTYPVDKNHPEKAPTTVLAGSEYLPSNEDWGQYGWTLINKEDAFNKIIELKRAKGKRDDKKFLNKKSISICKLKNLRKKVLKSA